MNVLPLSRLVVDERCQARTELSSEAIEDYANAYRADVALPPIDVMDVDGDMVVIDGFHRLRAAREVGLDVLPARVVGSGAMDEAIWLASRANLTHGVRRTNEDKRRAVEMALSSKGASMSDRAVAEHVGVTHPLVSKVRGEVETVTTSTERIGRDGKVYPAPPEREGHNRELSQWFSPPSVSDIVADMVCPTPTMRVLEPAAGNGALLRALVSDVPEESLDPANVTTHEIDPRWVAKLRSDGWNCIEGDYLEAPPPAELYDECVMNSPFEKGLDLRFLVKAMDESRAVTAVLRLNALCGVKRVEQVWEREGWAPRFLAFFGRRPPFDGGSDSDSSPRHDFCVARLERRDKRGMCRGLEVMWV